MAAAELTPANAIDPEAVRVLLVEDDDDHAELASNALYCAAVSIEVDRAASIADARAFLVDATYDAIIVDYHLPDGDGLSFVGQLRNAGVVTPALLLTGQGSEYLAMSAMRTRVDDYLPKRDGLIGDLLPRTVLRLVSYRRMVDSFEQSRSYADQLQGALLAARTAQFHVNNTLSVTLGCAEMILLSSHDPDRVEQMAHRIAESVGETTARLEKLRFLQSFSIDSALKGAEILDLG